MVIRQVGRPAIFRGKSLFELCCNLKNFGVNRIVYRKQTPEHLEKSFYRLTRVEPDMDNMLTKGKAWGEKVHRGHLCGIHRIDAGSKADWFLVPKDEENLYQVHYAEPPKTSPVPAIYLPPIWKMILQKKLTDNEDQTSQNLYQLPLKVTTRRD